MSGTVEGAIKLDLFSTGIWVFDFLLRELNSFPFIIINLTCMFVSRFRNSSWINLGKMEMHWLLWPERARVQLETPWIRDMRLQDPLASLSFFASLTILSTHTSPPIFPALSSKLKKKNKNPFAQLLNKPWKRSMMFRAGWWVDGNGEVLGLI